MFPPQRVYFRQSTTMMSLPARSSSGSWQVPRCRKVACSFSGTPAAGHKATRSFPFSGSSIGRAPGARDAGFGFISISGAAAS